MITRPPRPCSHGAVEPEASHIKLIDEQIDDPDEVILTDPVVEPIRKQRRLAALHAFDETVMDCPPDVRKA